MISWQTSPILNLGSGWTQLYMQILSNFRTAPVHWMTITFATKPCPTESRQPLTSHLKAHCYTEQWIHFLLVVLFQFFLSFVCLEA